ncbi:MAG: TraR/DksA family transcriptional regulator [Paracoccus sp. (in: a-proteobacteria)]|uniref:TraR/DksA family transcriptional regulator n=1 Tax=Paracoccus sp. TaxID=267 RepID=UPI0039189456
MDPQDIAAHFAPLLQLELSRLEKDSDDTAESRKPVELDQQSVGRLSRMDAMQNQAMASAVDARRHARIRAIRAALSRIKAGEFGYCEECGDPIPFRRLTLDPAFTRCVGCRG